MRRLPAGMLLLLFLLVNARYATANARDILEASGVQGGIVVHVGCEDGELLTEFRASDAFVVQGLDTDASKVAAARDVIRRRREYGVVSARQFDGTHLPYINNFVNLVVVDELGDLPMDEVMRVLAPYGVAWIGGKQTVKPWPAAMDEWPQYLHGADNNAVSQDTMVGPPRHLQWVTDPEWSRSHMTIATVNSMVSARGRLFTIEDRATPENPFLPGRFQLVAHDAFNGIVLWQRDIPRWEPITRYIKDMAIQLQRRVAAIDETVYCTLGVDAPLTALDAASGKTLKTYKATARTQEFAYDQGILFAVIGDRANSARYNIHKPQGGKGTDLGGTDPQSPFGGAGFRRGYAEEVLDKSKPRCAIVAIDAASTAEIWRTDSVTDYVAASLAIRGKYAVYQTRQGLVCLDARTGDKYWSVDKPISGGDGTSANTILLTDDVVYTQEDKTFDAYRLRTGKEAWSDKIAGNYEKSADLFFAAGSVWTGGARQPTNFDPTTGAQRRRIDQKATGPMGHDRCYRNFITERFYINSKTGGADFLDLATGRELPNHWLRGTCGLGVLPCNGMLYAPPYSCQCNIGSMLQNFNALYAEPGLERSDQPIEIESRVQLIRGPAYAASVPAEAALAPWPTYRRDGARSGATPAAISAQLAQAWTTRFTGVPSAPIVADGKVFVADVDAHTLHCLDANDGSELWVYIAGGRIDSPPTFHEGRIYFGSRDGWMHCVQARDGQLAWRFKDLPDRLMGAFGQIESAWPISGSALVKDNTVYFAAGRSSFLDGGMFLYGLDPATGEVKHRRRIYGPFSETSGFPSSSKTDSSQASGFKGGILVTDGNLLYLRHRAFHADLSNATEPGPHIIPSAGFLDATPQHRTYWTVGTGYGWTSVRHPGGDILVVRDDMFYEVCGFPTHRHSYFDPRKSGYQLFAGKLKQPSAPRAVNRKRRRRSGSGAKDRQRSDNTNEIWSTDIPLTGKAIVLAADKLFVAGNPMRFPKNSLNDYLASYAERTSGTLWVASTADGKHLADYELPAAPVWDSLVVADDRLYVSLKDGSLICLAAAAQRDAASR